MKTILISICALIVVAMAGTVSAGESPTEHGGQSPLYLGLALPVPDSPMNFPLSGKNVGSFLNRSIHLILKIDNKGRIIDYDYFEDSIAYFQPLRKRFKKLKFTFLKGGEIPFPQYVPVTVRYLSDYKGGKEVTIKFPVNVRGENPRGYSTDSDLLYEYFSLNDISVPAITNIVPLPYYVVAKKDDGRYLTVTALVTLDQNGNLLNISFPLKGMSEGNHPAYAALLNADFRPLMVHKQPLSSAFFVTFRVFDNLDYPYHPLLGKKSDSLLKETDKWFMTNYFNPADISAPPLPRQFPYGFLPVSGLSKKANGFGRVKVNIDTLGQISGISVLTVSRGLKGYIRDIAKRLSFYPAVDSSGKAYNYTGEIFISIDGRKNVVYNPEWLK